MNNNGYYQNPIFPGMDINNNSLPTQENMSNFESSQMNFNPNTMEMSYVENILRLNKGKKVKVYVTIPGSNEWQDKMFEGIIENIGRDHIIISNPNNGEWYLLLMMYIDFVTFEEPINLRQNF